MNIVRLAGDVRSGRRSAVEIAEEYLERSGSLQPRLNAYTLIEDTAVDRARRIDRLVEDGQDPGSLAGVPIALKDLIDQAGFPTTCGSAFYRRIPQKSATVVQRLEDAGAIVLGRTGLHEFAYGFSSENHWFGPVRNPWDPETSPGGSSGGSAVAIAAGLAPGAIGTDTGGSIRVPAALCGVAGLKVTHGRTPLTGVFPLAPSLDTVGPLGQTVGDLTALYAVLAGYDPTDPWSAPKPVRTPAEATMGLAGVTVGLPQPWLDDAPTSPPVDRWFRAAVDQIADAGADVREIVIPDLASSPPAGHIVGTEAAKVHRPWFGAKPYGPAVAKRLAKAFSVTVDEYLDALAWRAALRNTTAAAFDSVDFLLTPTVPATRKVIGEDLIDGVPYRQVLSWFSAPVNQLGVPAISLPLDAPGSPSPSIQVIAPWWQEHRLLELAKAFEMLGITAFRAPLLP